MPDPKPACPICGKPPVAPQRPFCSPRCAQIDLGRWLVEGYIVSGRDGDAVRGEPSDEDEG